MLWDQLLAECTVEVFKRVFWYSSENDLIEDSNVRCENEYKQRLQIFTERGNKFPEEQMQEYLEFHKANPFCKKNMDRGQSRNLVQDKSIVHKEKKLLVLLKLGID